MKFIACFGGGAAVVADEDEAAAALAASRRSKGPRRSLASSFRRKFLPDGKNKKKKPSPDTDADSVLYGASSTASSVPSSAPLSTADSAASTLSSPCSSSVSASSSSLLRALPSPRRTPKKRKTAAFPAAGVMAFVLCLLMVVLCGRVGATLLTSAALYLLPLRRRAAPVRKARRGGVDVDSPAVGCDSVSPSSASESEDGTAKRKQVVRKGSFLWRNRKQ